jgi:hypothetical protein
MMTTGFVPMGTRPTSSLHQRGLVETTVTYATSSAAEMHAARLKAGAEIRSVMSRNSMMRGTVITMAPTITILTGSILLKEGTFLEASRPILET